MDKKKTTHLITIGLIILFLSILVSYLIFNNNKPKETKKVDKSGTVVMNPPQDEKQPVEEEPPKEDVPKPPVQEPEPEPELPQKEEEPKKERAKLNVKYKVLKENTQEVTLNDKNHEVFTYYYVDPAKPRQIMKAVYFDTKLIYYGNLTEPEKDGDITPSINEDISKVKKYSYVFKDVSHTTDYYLIRLFTDYYRLDEDKEYSDTPYETVIILDKDGNFLFYNQVTYTGTTEYWLEIDNKEEILDRSYYVGECYLKRKMSDGNYACKNRYVLYDGTYDTELITPYAYEFLTDHFFGYSYEPSENDENDDPKVYDRVYYIQGGVLKTQILNTYEGEGYFQAVDDDYSYNVGED